MKTTYPVSNETDINSVSILSLNSCQQLFAKLTQVRDNIFREVADTSGANEHSIHLALNEAEALAWETGVPHLFFPTLAMEKIRSVGEWRARQNFLLRSEHPSRRQPVSSWITKPTTE